MRLAGLICISALATIVPFELQSDDEPGSRLYWLLSPQEYIEANNRGREELENCVARAGFVEYLKVIPHDDSTLIEVDIVNVSQDAITGLLIQPQDDRLKDLGLDGRSLISFAAISPNESATYSEEVESLAHTFPHEVQIEIVAWDLVDENGDQIVRDIFWTNWPTVRSEEELERVRDELCNLRR